MQCCNRNTRTKNFCFGSIILFLLVIFCYYETSGKRYSELTQIDFYSTVIFNKNVNKPPDKFIQNDDNLTDANITTAEFRRELRLLSIEMAHIQNLTNTIRNQLDMQTQLRDQKVQELVPKSDDTGIFVHSNIGIVLCGRETITLLVIIIGSYEELSERFTVRDTWAKDLQHLKMKGQVKELKWKHVFVVTTPGDNKWSGIPFLETELKSRRDILRVELQEHDSTQGVKLYAALMWALNNCNFKYALVTRVRHFVNIPAFYKLLHSKHLPQTLYAGHFEQRYVPVPQVPRKTNKHTWVNKTITVMQNDAFMLSYDLVRNGMKILKDYSVVRPISPEIMVSETMTKLGVKPWSMVNFVHKTNCTYNSSYLLNDALSFKCYDKLYEQYLTTIR